MLGGALVFCWPLARVPPLGLANAGLHLFGAWAVLIGLLWWRSRRLDDGREGGDRHG